MARDSGSCISMVARTARHATRSRPNGYRTRFQSHSGTTYDSDILNAISQLEYGYLWWSGVSGSHRRIQFRLGARRANDLRNPGSRHGDRHDRDRDSGASLVRKPGARRVASWSSVGRLIAWAPKWVQRNAENRFHPGFFPCIDRHRSPPKIHIHELSAIL